MVPSKEEGQPAQAKQGHKSKKIKNSKVVEYTTGSAKKAGQEQV